MQLCMYNTDMNMVGGCSEANWQLSFMFFSPEEKREINITIYMVRGLMYYTSLHFNCLIHMYEAAC